MDGTCILLPPFMPDRPTNPTQLNPSMLCSQGQFIDQNSFFGADVALNDAGTLLVVSAPAFKPAGTGEGSCE